MLSVLFRIFCWAIPLTTAYLILFDIQGMMNVGGWPAVLANFDHPVLLEKVNLVNFSLAHRFILLAIEFLPISLTVLIFYKLSGLFRLYAEERYFEEKNVQLIKGIGICIVSGQLIQIIYQPIITLALTYTNPIGERYIALGLGTTNAASFITGFVIIVASCIIKEANKLKSESQLTI